MSKEEIFSLIAKKKLELDKPLEVDPRVSHCQKWVDKHKYMTIEEFPNIDVYELLDYLMPILLDIKDIETANHVSEIFMNFFYHCSADEVISFVNIAADLYASGEIDKVICMLEAGSKEEADKIEETIVNLDKDFLYDLRFNKGYEYESEISEDFATMLHVLNNHESSFFDILVLLASHKCVREKYDEVDDTIERYSYLGCSKERRRVAEKYKKKMFKLDYAMSIANRASSFISEYNQKQKKMEHSKQLKISKLDELERKLRIALEKEEITNVREIVNGIDYPDLAIAVLELIREHNKPYYERLTKEYNDLSCNNEANYKALLHDFGIKSKDYDINKIMHLKIEDIRNILGIIIRKFNFIEATALRILEVSSLDRVNLISKYISNGYVSIDYVSNNIDLYDLNNNKTEILGKNIEILNSYNVNPYMFKNSIDVLFGDSILLDNNLQLLKDYDLVKYFKTTDNYMFLLDSNLSSIIDKYLELGFESLLKEDLGILNFKNLKRLDVIHMLNIQVDSIDELQELLESKRFFLSDNDIDSYLLNDALFHEKEKFDISIDELDSLKSSNRCYSFDGVLVSIQKVNRLLNDGYDLYDAIFANMNVSEDEYNRVVNCLGQFVR